MLPKISDLIKDLAIPQLRELVTEIEARVDQLREDGRRAALERLTAEAAALGFDTLEDLIGVRRRGRPRTTGNGHDQQQTE